MKKLTTLIACLALVLTTSAFAGLIEKPETENRDTLEFKVKGIRRLNTQIYNSMKQLHTTAFHAVWEDQDFKPKQIIEGFGTDCKALFENSAQIQTILATVDPGYVPLAIPEGYSISFNPDGSCSVTEPLG